MTAPLRPARRVAVLAAGTSLLVALVVVSGYLPTNRVERPDYTVTDRSPESPQINQQAVDDIVREMLPAPDPVPIGGLVVLAGDPGVETAQLRVVAKAGVGSYLVSVRNIGAKPFGDPVSAAIWLETSDRQRYRPSDVRPPAVGGGTIAPGAESDHLVVFPLPPGSRPVDLRIRILLGWRVPTAEWVLSS